MASAAAAAAAASSSAATRVPEEEDQDVNIIRASCHHADSQRWTDGSESGEQYDTSAVPKLKPLTDQHLDKRDFLDALDMTCAPEDAGRGRYACKQHGHSTYQAR